MRLAIYILLILFVITMKAGVFEHWEAVKEPESVAQAHTRQHLMASDDDIADLRQVIQSDPTALRLYQIIKQAGEEIAEAAPPDFSSTGNKLPQARLLLQRVYTLGILARLTLDSSQRDQYAREVMRQTESALNAASWRKGGTPFLAVAETTHALAVAYDWFYEWIDEEQRQRLLNAIAKNGLKQYKKGLEREAGWTRKNGNWAFVVHGGALIGALAIADKKPDLAHSVQATAIPALRGGISRFGDAGGWWEGPTYWGYASRYAVYAAAAMLSSSGNNNELFTAEEMSNLGNFLVGILGNSGELFNFADAGERARAHDENQLFWLDRQYGRPAGAFVQKDQYLRRLLSQASAREEVLPLLEKNSRPYALNLLWYSSSGVMADLEELPLAQVFRAENLEVGVLRSGWGTGDSFVAMKAGRNGVSHSHLDLGTFVLDIAGERWAIELGKDDYDVPGYWDTSSGNRWQVYRVSSDGHNVITIGSKNQSASAYAPLKLVSIPGAAAQMTVDLSDAYSANGMDFAARTIGLSAEPNVVLLKDEVEATELLRARWVLHTRADVSLDGHRVNLRKNDKAVLVTFQLPPGAYLFVEPASPKRSHEEAENTGVTRLVVDFSLEPQRRASLSVEFRLLNEEHASEK